MWMCSRPARRCGQGLAMIKLQNPAPPANAPATHANAAYAKERAIEDARKRCRATGDMATLRAAQAVPMVKHASR